MNGKLIVIGYVWPEPKSSAAGSRMLQLIYTFLLGGYDVTFASPCAKTENAFDLNLIGVSQKTIELNNSSFDVFIKQLNPDVVLFDRFMMEEQFGWRVAENCPNALRILDTEDLHFLRKGRHQALKDGTPFGNNYLFNDTAKREIASIYRCDLSLIISEAEIEVLKSDFKVDASLLVYLPFMLDNIDEAHISTLSKFEERGHFISIGNFLHAPNYDAVLYLKQTIWPLIRKKLSNAEIHIYGAYASEKVNQLHSEKQGFLIKGFTADANQTMQSAKICLAPLRFGAGLKGKLVDAMQNGTPCIMSSIGAEGIFGDMEHNGFIADEPESFSNKAVELFNNEKLWASFQNNGFKVVNTRFKKEKFQQKLLSRVNQALQRLKAHRENNFMGQMLMHHSLKSTKYLSKWIEAKNQ
ncbi:glycosyltransferase family 4 protein [Hyunsoonleella sp. SJ7]|uniref:Glycosyltransferase family 4 protein n=1 Tax=Hyunsoonleella aquatilis TaxID=2762758 RepID=A0A923KJR6_9FLAO|nr:glycosyltransferase [Hyunsoonleella aquatilis]MBC3757702.1 glycosyltransferase family 4 protein [Hyunsoonleella aquatilis]